MTRVGNRPILNNSSDIYSSITAEKSIRPNNLINPITTPSERQVNGITASKTDAVFTPTSISHSLSVVQNLATRRYFDSSAAWLTKLGVPRSIPETAVFTPVGGFGKRATDIVIASMALILIAPLMLAVSALIYLTMGRPVLFAQQRVGANGVSFRCYKFRSMVTNAQEKLAQYLTENPEAARMWQETQKLKDDPRITPLGHILRKTSIDELPQLFNVLRGDMSCIGPRPVLASELQRYGKHAAEYLKAKPGLTGLWQVSGRSNTGYAERVKLDRFYVRRWSFWLDLVILLKTIPALMRLDDTA